VAVGHFPQEDSFKLEQAVELNFAIFGDHNQILIIVSEFELHGYLVHHDLVLDHESIGVVDVDVVPVLSH